MIPALAQFKELKVRRILKWALPLILLFLVMAWLLLPQILPWLANRLVAGSGITFQELQIQTVGWKHIALHRAVLQVDNIGRLSIEDITLSQHTDVKAFDVQIASSTLSLANTSASANTVNEGPPQQLSAYLPSSRLSQLPSIQLKLVHFVLEGREPDSRHFLDARDLLLSADPDKVTLNGSLNLNIDNQLESFELAANLFNTNSAQLSLTKTGDTAPLLNFALELAHAEGVIGGSVDILLAQDKPVPLHLELSQPFTKIAGSTDTHIEFELKDQALETFIHAPELTLRGEIAAEGRAGDKTQGMSSAHFATNFALTLQNRAWQIDLDAVEASPGPLLQFATPVQGKLHQLFITTPRKFTLNGQLDQLKSAPQAIHLKSSNTLFAEYRIGENPIATNAFRQIEWNGVWPSHPEFKVAFDALLEADIDQLLKHSNLLLTDKPKNKKEAAATAPFQAEHSTLKLPARLVLNRNTAQLEVEDGARLIAAKLTGSFGELFKPTIELPAQEFTLNYSSAMVDELRFNLKAEKFLTGAQVITPVNIRGQILPNGNRLDVRIESQKTALRQRDKSKPFALPPYILHAQVLTPPQTPYSINAFTRAAATEFEFELRNECQTPLLSGSVEHYSDLKFEATHTFSETNSLSRWLDIPQLNTDITAGNLHLNIAWDLDQNTLPHIEFQLSNAQISGALGNMEAVQLQLSTSGPKSNYHYDMTAKAASIDIGALITGLTFSGTLIPSKEEPALAIKRMDASVFGGNISIAEEFWLAGKDEVVILNLNDIKLKEIVETQVGTGLETTGRLTGQQPLRISAAGELTLIKGTLKNTESGVIRYHSALSDSADLNPQMKLTMNVLKNFQYEMLETETEYQDGNLVFHSQISGRNPDVAGGQKVNLNLNTEVALGSAIQAMRLKAGLEARVESLFKPHTNVNATAYCRASQ